MLKNCPNPIDVQDLQFKLRCRLKVFDNDTVDTFPNWHSLVSSASRYGLLFVGSFLPILQVIQTKYLESCSPKDKDIKNYPHRTIPLPNVPLHISVNCDCTILAVVVEKDDCPTVIFFDVLSFYKQNVAIIKETRLSATPGVLVSEVGWNPALPGVFTACKSNGSLGVYEIKDNSIDINEIPAAAESCCFCWSPKGKRIAVGSKNGKITQYKSDLKAVAVINQPPLDGSHSLISLKWVANYQFVGIYQSVQQADQTKLIVIDAPKSGENVYTNYEDICYSGSARKAYFYMIFQQHWNILMVASSNSSELGVLGATGENWLQWILSDTARAELPLTADHQDAFPVGATFDTSPNQPVPWGEATIPPCPYLVLLSHTGVMCVFDVVNLKQGAPTVCCPPDNVVDTSGLSQFTTAQPTVIEVNLGVGDVAPQPTTPPTAFAAVNPQPAGATLSSFFAQQPQTPKAEVTRPSAAAVKSPATSVASPFHFQAQPHGEQSLFGGQQTGSTLTFARTGTTDKPLFGGDTSKPASSTQQSQFSPVKFKPPTVESSANPVQNLFGGQISITPLVQSKLAQPQTSTTSTVDKYASTFQDLKTSAHATPQSSQLPTQQLDAARQNLLGHLQVKTPEKPAAPQHRQIISVKHKQGDAAQPKPVTNQSVDEASLKDDTRLLLEKMIREECACLEVELRALLEQGRAEVKIDIGDEKEKTQLVKQVQQAQEFIEEIVEVSLGQNAEVHSLKQDLIFSWALYEDILSRYNNSKDETMSLILESQPLDPVAERRQTETKKVLYYIESQLSQASKALDEQWDRFQDYAKKTYRTQQMPTMEAIFQTMVKQNAVLQKQMYMLKDISSHVKRKSTVSLLDAEPHLLLSPDNSILLESEMEKLSIGTEAIQKHNYEKTVQRSRRFTEKKNDKLRQALKNRSVTHVSSVQPHLLSVLDTSRAKLKSLLSARMSPLSKPSQAESDLRFVQSTPIKKEQPAPKPLLFKSPQCSTPTTAAAAFQPFSKAVPSAFAPTAQTQSKLLNFQPQSISSSTPLPTDKSTVTFSFGNTELASVGNDPKAPMVVPLAKTFDTTTKPSTPSPSAFSFSTSKPTTFGGSTTVQTKALPIVTMANTNVTLPSFTLNFGSVSTTTPASTMTPKVTAASTTVPSLYPSLTTSLGGTTAPSLYPSLTASLGGTTTTTPAFSKVTVSAASPATAPLGSTANLYPSLASVAPGYVTVSSTTVPVTSEGKTVVTKPATTPATSFFTSVSSTTPSFGSTSSQSSVLGVVNATTSSITPLSSGTTATAGALISEKPAPVLSDLATKTTTSSSISVFGMQSPSTASPKPSFGTSASSGSIFTSTASVTTGTSIFGSTGTSTTSTAAFPSTTAAASVFGSSVASTAPSSTGSIFGSPVSTTLSGSVFASGTTSLPSGGSIFGGSSTGTASGKIFGVSKTPTTSVFSNATVANTSSSGAPVFGSAASTTSGGGSIFQGGTSIFGSGTTSGSTVFGSTPTSSVFGAKPTTGSIFDSVPSSTAPSVFGGTSPPASTTPSIFGSTSPPPASTTPSIFGSTAPPPASTTPSIFGSTSPPPATTKPSVFGGSTPAFGQPAPMFGSAATTKSGGSIFATAAASPSLFGTGSTASPPQSIFGSSPSAASSGGGSLFGTATAAASSPFGSAPVFGGATATGTTSPFGQGGGVFGGNPAAAETTTSSSVFGQPAAVFGQQQASRPPSVFGGAPQQPRSTFGSTTSAFGGFAQAAQGTASTGGVFGFGGLSVSGGDGGASAFGSATSSPAPPANPFSRPADQKSIFGSGETGGTAFGSSTSIFGSAATGGSFRQTGAGSVSPGGGPFSGGGTAIAQTGFAAAASGASPSAASSPAFGAPPSFGGAPAFGATPAFGSAPAFGSPQSKLFGAAVAQSPPANNIAQGGTFGSAAIGGSPGFGNLASQNTIGFGSLAQQAQTPSSTPFSGNSSFSTWR